MDAKLRLICLGVAATVAGAQADANTTVVTVAEAKSGNLIGSFTQMATFENVRVTNLFDLVDTPLNTLINVEDDTGGIAIIIQTPSATTKYDSLTPGDVVDITGFLVDFFGLAEIADAAIGRPAATITPNGVRVAPTVTTLPLSAFPGDGQQNAGTTMEDPFFEALESTQILFENVSIDEVRLYDNFNLDPPTVSVPDGSTVTFPAVLSDNEDYVTLRLNDGVLAEADRPLVRVRSSSSPVIGQVIPTGQVNVRSILYDVAREDGFGEGRYRPYVIDVESTVFGDVDYDNDVDASDYATAEASFTQPAGLAGSTAPTGIQFAGDPVLVNSWDDGNVDRDHDVDNTDLLAIIGAITTPAASGPAGDYTLSYDPDTGGLFIDTEGGVLTGYSLQGDSFAANAHSTLLSGTATSHAVEVSEAELGSTLTGSQLSLGALLPTGLTESAFAALFDSATYTAEPGTGVQSFSFALVAEPVPGDFNGDGMVNAADYTVWRDNFGEPEAGGTLNGNGNGGNVDGTDYTLWADNYGTGTPSVAAVPEPTAWLLVFVGVAGRGRRGNRSRGPFRG